MASIYMSHLYTRSPRTWLRAVPYIPREDERENEKKKEIEIGADKILGMEINSRNADQASAPRRY